MKVINSDPINLDLTNFQTREELFNFLKNNEYEHIIEDNKITYNDIDKNEITILDTFKKSFIEGSEGIEYKLIRVHDTKTNYLLKYKLLKKGMYLDSIDITTFNSFVMSEKIYNLEKELKLIEEKIDYMNYKIKRNDLTIDYLPTHIKKHKILVDYELTRNSILSEIRKSKNENKDYEYKINQYDERKGEMLNEIKQIRG